MSDSDREKTADALDRDGADPAVESGAGYGSHAPAVEPDPAADTETTGGAKNQR